MAKGKANNQSEIGLFHMLRDVLVASINKGQFPLAIAGLVLVTMIVKMPGDQVAVLVFKIYDSLCNGYLVGYGLFLIVTVAWFVHAKWQRRIMREETDRVVVERNKLQDARVGSRFSSSKD